VAADLPLPVTALEEKKGFNLRSIRKTCSHFLSKNLLRIAVLQTSQEPT
jgi:hypothetical protein